MDWGCASSQPARPVIRLPITSTCRMRKAFDSRCGGYTPPVREWIAPAPEVRAKPNLEMDAGTDARPTELCNGIDDDADGTEDEGLGLGMTCVSGRGECRQPGLIVCVGDGLADCSGIATAPGIESAVTSTYTAK